MVRIFFQFEGGSTDGIWLFLLAFVISLILMAWGFHQRRQER